MVASVCSGKKFGIDNAEILALVPGSCANHSLAVPGNAHLLQEMPNSMDVALLQARKACGLERAWQYICLTRLGAVRWQLRGT